MNPNNVLKLAGLILVAQLMLSCSSYKNIKNSPSVINSKLKKGSKVKIETNSGQIYYLRTTKITDTHVHGVVLYDSDGKNSSEIEARKVVVGVAFSDMRSIKKGKFSPAKTAGLAVGYVGVSFVIAAIGVLALIF